MSYLEVYDLEMTTLAPVYIGSGLVIGKKDYIKTTNNLIFLDTQKMIRDLIADHRYTSYENFMSDPNDHRSLKQFFDNINYRPRRNWIRYRVKIGNPGALTDINMFIRDAYGLPYVPGSSLKGALRTCLAAEYFSHHSDDADDVADLIYNENDYIHNHNIQRYQSDANKAIGIKSFHQQITDPSEHRTELDQMVNDTMRGLIVSDSKSLCNEDLCICQKIDWSVNTQSEPLTVRECIKPGVKLQFTITVDPYLFKRNAGDIKTAINTFYQRYQQVVLDRFQRLRNDHTIPFVDPIHNNNPSNDVLYLGGGVGYVSKTLTYNVFNNINEANDEVQFILDKLFHNHRRDPISPRKMKCTRYNGKDYQFGPCKITRFEPIDELQI